VPRPGPRGYAVDWRVAESRDPPNGAGASSVDRDDPKLRCGPWLDHDRHDIRTAVAIDVDGDPRRPVAKAFEFADGVCTNEVDSWIEQSEARKMPHRLFEKRRHCRLRGSNCTDEEHDET